LHTYQLDIYDQSDNEPEQDYQQGAYGQSVRINSGCNGVSGPYAISTNQTLLTGSFPSTMVSCNESIDEMESHIRRMMLYNDSQLTLMHSESYPVSGSVNEFKEQKPSYLLTQKLETGETLVWQNEAKKKT
jgi:heat shock protein HslJ